MYTEEQKQLMLSLLEKAATDQAVLIQLKNLAVSTRQYELSVALKELENNQFPETDEQIAARKEAMAIQMVFSMTNIKVSVGTCWLITKTALVYNKKKGSFSLKDASEIIAAKEKLFPLDHLNTQP